MSRLAFIKAVPVIINGKDAGLMALYHEVQHIGIDPNGGYINVTLQSYASQQSREAGVAPYTGVNRQYAKSQLDVDSVLNPGDKGVLGALTDFIITNDEMFKDAKIAQV